MVPAGRNSRWSLRALGGRMGADWDRERRDTLFLMGAVLLSVLPQMAWIPGWCTAGFLVLFAWRLGLVMSGRPLPGTVVRLIAAAAILAGVLAEYRSIFGREAGVALLILFLGLKLMEMRARRDLFVVIFLCCFLLITGYFHSQGILMAGATFAALLTLVASMLTMQFRRQELPIKRRFRYAGALMLQAIPVAAVLFVLFPRAAGPLWGMPGDAHAGKTGLSEAMAPGDIADLAQSDDVVMRVQFDGSAPPTSRMYWRGPTFGHFDGRTWRPLSPALLPPAPTALTQAPSITAAPVRYTATVEPSRHRWIVMLETAAGEPAVVERTVRTMPTLERIANRPLTERFEFDGAASFDAKPGLGETTETLRPWLRLPSGSNPRALALAQDWIAARPDASAEQRVEQLMNWLREGDFTYTLAPPLLGAHTVDEFIFDTREGFCEHFSNAFAFLARALGLPARVVTGYQGAEANRGSGYWIVRQSDAHAWTEVWLAGKGWTRIDPTAVVAPDRINRGGSMLRNPERFAEGVGHQSTWLDTWRLGVDSVTHAWNRWILTYDRSRQASLLARLGLDGTDWRELAAALAATMVLVLGAVALTTLRPRRSRDPAEREFERFCERAAEAGAPRQPFETPNSYLYRIERLLDDEPAGQAQRIVAAYNRLRYDCPQPDPAGLVEFRRMVRAFRP